MGKAFNVSENIGFDGYSYYCRRCGKAGYSKPTQVRGHLAMCNGTLIRKGLPPTTSSNHLPTRNHGGLHEPGANQLQPVTSASFGALPDSQLQPVGSSSWPGSYQLDEHYQQLDRRIAAMENEYNHFLMERNRPKSESWLNKNLGWLVLGGILLVAVLSGGLGQMCQCPSGIGQSQPTASRSSGLNSLGSKLVGKAAERAMMKSVDRMFG